MAPVYIASGLRRYYNSELALAIPEFSLEQGACLVLTGANGSGKSTFLRLLAFLEKPDCGILRYLGPGEARRQCTLLLQEPWLLHMNIFHNVTLGLRLRKQRTDLRIEYIAAMTASGFTDPDAFAERRPGSLSGGEKQRAALAARLILHPAVLLLDEPTAYVDAKSAECIISALRLAHAGGMTIICATHDTALRDSLNAEIMQMQKP